MTFAAPGSALSRPTVATWRPGVVRAIRYTAWMIRAAETMASCRCSMGVGPRVVGESLNGDVPALDAHDALDQSDVDAGPVEHEALFDVKLEVRRQ